jgi:hypothetical protein
VNLELSSLTAGFRMAVHLVDETEESAVADAACARRIGLERMYSCRRSRTAQLVIGFELSVE